MELCDLNMTESYTFVDNHKRNSENDDDFDSKGILYFLRNTMTTSLLKSFREGR